MRRSSLRVLAVNGRGFGDHELVVFGAEWRKSRWVSIFGRRWCGGQGGGLKEACGRRGSVSSAWRRRGSGEGWWLC
jgi:hypothetical protein